MPRGRLLRLAYERHDKRPNYFYLVGELHTTSAPGKGVGPLFVGAQSLTTWTDKAHRRAANCCGCGLTDEIYEFNAMAFQAHFELIIGVVAEIDTITRTPTPRLCCAYPYPRLPYTCQGKGHWLR